ncbi:unnamed protein product [Darwinula stevensoni]|uniref:Uncharacterized protein n=1 Tax=Darwinula stevensoni TaxID=69355 RepID=A0A7R8XAT5_9CRUS|nr:unnamed protein product [Darwinula stevensoni]CAG0890590.1 unnamed protein product [Darwinula stevensoni]
MWKTGDRERLGTRVVRRDSPGPKRRRSSKLHRRDRNEMDAPSLPSASFRARLPARRRRRRPTRSNSRQRGEGEARLSLPFSQIVLVSTTPSQADLGRGRLHDDPMTTPTLPSPENDDRACFERDFCPSEANDQNICLREVALKDDLDSGRRDAIEPSEKNYAFDAEPRVRRPVSLSFVERSSPGRIGERLGAIVCVPEGGRSGMDRWSGRGARRQSFSPPGAFRLDSVAVVLSSVWDALGRGSPGWNRKAPRPELWPLSDPFQIEGTGLISCRTMTQYTLPVLYLNLGGEMMYIIRQRLGAQEIEPSKVSKGEEVRHRAPGERRASGSLAFGDRNREIVLGGCRMRGFG